MPSFHLLLLPLWLPVSLLPARQNPALPKAEEILAKMDAAIGDPAARAKIQHVVVRGTFTVPEFPEGKFEQVYAGTDRAKWTTDFGICVVFEGMTPEFTWNACTGRGIAIMEGDAAASFRAMYTLGRGAILKSVYSKIEVVKKTEVGGRPAYELKMSYRKGTPDVWLVDAETWRPLRVDSRIADPIQECSLRIEPSDWKAVDGVFYPFTTTTTMGAAPFVFKTTSVEHPAAIDKARLEPGDEVVAAWKDPKKRLQAAPDKAGECSRVTLEPRPAATVRVRVSEKDTMQALASIFPEIMSYLSSVGVDITSPVFTRYHERKDGMVDLEAGMAVKKPIAPKGRIQPSELPGGETAVTWHFGKYEDVVKTHALLERWARSNGMTPRGGAWEIYWTDPGLEPDPAKWKTQIFLPIKGAR